MANEQYKIAVVGNRDAILPFRLIGFDTFPVVSGEQAQRRLDELAKQAYGIIYLTEDFAEMIPETIRYYDTLVTPAVILIPTHKGCIGIGSQRIRENVEKAVGQNIL
ncbi:V-type ATP synthase subunit F [Aerococcaceae bacterium NML191292]|nr:V-type ATP synthase subunit F [Aerococcaceae bacterium NML210727]MCW6654106.1 V-type ATP synthase subunit F [Aerococcaceae bacterium NML201296]MCW6659855.1 V-type ATP synthase subunit F [Aerococcaceae bacterium NML191292]MCW6661445.1 V-type ATP synthase subunit F [Aerococcaceae bacterium NML201209]MCW6665021.1 V-type ATP synthase subunit F [Aerococcaceae bacterium NML191219]MCW6666379.1 V-type ATP synthase subunit F [Aerococcaceae bacterium NML190938]MCW6675265.1 V-type ATP synthase subuni